MKVHIILERIFLKQLLVMKGKRNPDVNCEDEFIGSLRVEIFVCYHGRVSFVLMVQFYHCRRHVVINSIYLEKFVYWKVLFKKHLKGNFNGKDKTRYKHWL